jgi:methylenetetrahydrofolate reductase (NADPH)
VPRIDRMLTAGRTFSFEFFPPKTDEGERLLRRALNELADLEPSFVSVTYGAGGSDRERTHRIVSDIDALTPMTAMAHLTLVSHTREELTAIIKDYKQDGITNILALRGDPPTSADAPPSELEFAHELVDLIREVGGDDFSVGVAAHPYVHPLSAGRTSDRRHLADKLAHADFAITQFVFEATDWSRLVEELAAIGCDKPVIPGIMPVTNVRQIERMAELSGAPLPAWLPERLRAAGDNPEDVVKLGIELATTLCQDLLAAGAPGLHFYTLNRSSATREIYANLNPLTAVGRAAAKP